MRDTLNTIAMPTDRGGNRHKPRKREAVRYDAMLLARDVALSLLHDEGVAREKMRVEEIEWRFAYFRRALAAHLRRVRESETVSGAVRSLQALG